MYINDWLLKTTYIPFIYCCDVIVSLFFRVTKDASIEYTCERKAAEITIATCNTNICIS